MAGNSILVVDDERAIQKILEFNLKKQGYEVQVAKDGLEALEKVRKNMPDLIILDLMMPHKNGYEVCEEIRADPNLKDILIILLTAKGQEIDRDKGMEVGADLYATKPFSPRALLESVADLLNRE